MSKKSEQTVGLLDLIHPPLGIPEPPDSGTMLERGMILVLQRHLTPPRAVAAVEALRKAYEDWNEARVAQAQELASFLAPRSTGPRSPDKLTKFIPSAREAKAYLQEVFQRTHGLDLEFLRTDPAAGAKVIAQLPMLGNYLGSVLLWIAEPGEQPLSSGHIRVLDRLKLITRTSSIKKAREAVAPLVDKSLALRFSVAIGYVADAWCDSRKPLCWDCPLREECPTGKKIFKDWKVQQERLSAQRAREHSRRLAQEARDQARMKRENAREQKKAEVDKARRERAEARERSKAESARKPASKSSPSKAQAKEPAKAKAKSGGAKPNTAARAVAAKSDKAAAKSSKSEKAPKKSGKSKPAKGSSTGKRGVSPKKTGRR